MKTRGRPRHPETLTPRQQDVLALLRQGLTNEEIAERLGITLDGAKYHVSDILRRLQVDNRYEAASWQPTPARRWAFLPLPLALLGGTKTKAALQALAATAITASAVGIGLLAWGIVRTRDDEPSDARSFDPDRIIAADAADLPVSPSGESRVFSYDTTTGAVAALQVPSFEPTKLSPDGASMALWLPQDLLIAGMDGSQHVVDRAAAGAAPTDWSADGERMLVAGSEALTELHLASGNVTTLIEGNVQDAVWSPDERSVAYVHDQQLGVLDIESGDRQLIAPGLVAMYLPGQYGDGHLAWSPDGELIAFGHWTAEEPVSQGRSDLYVVRPDGSDLRRLTESTGSKQLMSFSPDGEKLAYVRGTDDVDIIDLSSGSIARSVAKMRSWLASAWITDDAFLASGAEGVVTVSLSNSTTAPNGMAIATSPVLPSSPECQRSLVGWSPPTIIFRNTCQNLGTTASPLATPRPDEATIDGCPIDDASLCDVAVQLQTALNEGDAGFISSRILVRQVPCDSAFHDLNDDIGCDNAHAISDPVIMMLHAQGDCCYVPAADFASRLQDWLAEQDNGESWRLHGIVPRVNNWDGGMEILLTQGSGSEAPMLAVGAAPNPASDPKSAFRGVIVGPLWALFLSADEELLPWS